MKLATAVVDDVRRRVQQQIHGHRGRKNDPLHRVRNIRRAGVENLTDRQQARLEAALRPLRLPNHWIGPDLLISPST